LERLWWEDAKAFHAAAGGCNNFDPGGDGLQNNHLTGVRDVAGDFTGQAAQGCGFVVFAELDLFAE
jgi:hypothetical protein